MKDDFEFLRGLANCSDKEQMMRYIEEHQPKPMTNADRIRAMSDEELANRMYWCYAGSDAIPFCKNLPECGKMMDEGSEIPDEKCIGCMLDWLKRPAEKI